MIEIQAKWLNINWHRDSGKMKVVKTMSLPILGIANRVALKLGTWSVQTDFVIVKMDDFDVLHEIEFLLKKIFVLMPLAKCLVITRSTPTVVQTRIKQPNSVKMILTLKKYISLLIYLIYWILI